MAMQLLKKNFQENFYLVKVKEKLNMTVLVGSSRARRHPFHIAKYEEDVFINNHTSVWGLFWEDHQWGYKCCKQTIRNSYCTGSAGIEAAEAAADLMRANTASKGAVEEMPDLVEEKRLATLGTEVPDDLLLDEKKLAEALKKEDERRREEKDERKRKYNVKWNDEVTAEEMEAYRMKRIHHYDPMKDFL